MLQDAKSPSLTPALCRGARGLLDWTQTDLAERAAVSRSTVKDFEAGLHELQRASAAQLIRALAEGGVAIRRVDGLGVGLFLEGDGTRASDDQR